MIPIVLRVLENGFAFDWSIKQSTVSNSDSVTSIGDYAFAGWNSNNQPLVIPNSVTSIRRSGI